MNQLHIKQLDSMQQPKQKKAKFCWAKRKTCPNLNFLNVFLWQMSELNKEKGEKERKKETKTGNAVPLFQLPHGYSNFIGFFF